MNRLNRLMRFNRLITRAFSIIALAHVGLSIAATPLADQPLFAAGVNQPGNVALALSVEFPTALGSAYTDSYATANTYLGYFDSEKCYQYHTETDITLHYFEPTGAATSHTCSGKWSGNFLNWALTQTIDPFRSALTGGYRSVDQVGLTVLEKAWASGQGGTVASPSISGSALIAGATPYSNLTNFKMAIAGYGNKFRFTSTASNFNNPLADTSVPASGAMTTTNKGRVFEMYARVKVCVPNLLESNCVVHGSNYKPEGLIQANASKLNFAAFGYLNDSSDNPQRDGAVLRAKMAPLGPSSVNPEWSASTGIFYTNPDTADAAASGVTNSGVINYLNKFGLTSPGYKTFDPVSELYYTVVRYFKNQGNVASYTSNLDSTKIDGFPVITSWNDPIKSRCQSNFIIGVGDTNSWADANLPGSTIYTNTSADPTTQPSEVANDTTVDVTKATNKVGELEGINAAYGQKLGEINTPWCCTGNTFFMAGLAYDSHTVDMRPDLDGKQLLTTYWLDVLESGDRKDSNVTGMRNQFWLTAKYGGFTVPAGYLPYADDAVAPTTSQWDTSNDNIDDPDNYFRANNPANMISGLKKAFADIIKSLDGSSISFATSSPTVSSGTLTYATTYDSDGWIGNVVAKSTSINSSGAISRTDAWNASAKMETQFAATKWDTNRLIATSTCTTDGSGTPTACGVPFRATNLVSNQLDQLSTTASDQPKMLNYLRGERANEGTLFRPRTKLLGDIINSKVVPEGPPNQPLIDSANPGYSTFVSTYKNRKTVAYVGANDGMLHAFDGTSASTGGNELFAYVPNALFAGPNGSPSVDGLAALGNTTFVHHQYVDATPTVADVNFGASSSDWHTLLVSGLGKGGKSYFAIDVTDPSTFTDETKLASAVKWEFAHPDMGYSYARPVMTKVIANSWVAKKTDDPTIDRWVVILPSGYNNSDGKAYFFILDPSNGALLAKVAVNDTEAGASDTGVDAGMAHVSAFIGDARIGVADAVYAGDLLGNVWRLDLTGSSDASPVRIAKLKAEDGSVQPVTTFPIIEIDNSTGKRFVFVGTGKLLDTTDLNGKQKQTFYAINDGTFSSVYSATTLPSVGGAQLSFPITRDNLVDDTNSILTGISPSAIKPMGYFIDLGAVGTKPYLINSDMASGAGVITFAANMVDNSDSCSPTGTNLTYMLTYGNGKTVLTSNSSGSNSGGTVTPVANISSSGLNTSLTMVKVNFTDIKGNSVSKIVMVNCNDQGECKIIDPLMSSAIPFTQMNWRELPTAE